MLKGIKRGRTDSEGADRSKKRSFARSAHHGEQKKKGLGGRMFRPRKPFRGNSLHGSTRSPSKKWTERGERGLKKCLKKRRSVSRQKTEGKVKCGCGSKSRDRGSVG